MESYSFEHCPLNERAQVLKAAGRGASVSRFESQKQFRKRWLAAGAPQFYRERYELGKGVTRLWDLPSRRERWEDRKNPARVKTRVSLAQNRIKYNAIKRRIRYHNTTGKGGVQH